jgi:hypothetical protein
MYLVMAGLAALACWLWWPALFPAHVEGFSASIPSLARHYNDGAVALYDPLFPFNFEFFWLSRLGMNGAVAWLARVPSVSTELSLRLWMWIGFALLVWSSTRLIRLWANVPTGWAFAALLVIPGVSESAFFFNDNVLAAGLSTMALVVVAERGGSLATTFAGVLFGLAVLTRTDVVLVAPLVAVVGAQRHGLRAAFVRHGLLFAAGALLSFCLGLAWVGVSPFELLRVERHAVVLWKRGASVLPHGQSIVVFLGLPGLVLCCYGLLHVVRERNTARRVLLVGVPLLYNVVYLGKLWQSRQLLPLTPVVGALCVLGARHVLGQTRWPLSRFGVGVMMVMCIGVLMPAPALAVRDLDGPRSLTGRLWSQFTWRRWQRSISSDLAALEDAVGRFDGRTVVITNDWNADRYTHLALQSHGLVATAMPDSLEACSALAESFARNDTSVLHVRLHTPFLWPAAGLATERFATLAPCMRVFSAEHVAFVGPRGQAARYFADAAGNLDVVSDHPRVGAPVGTSNVLVVTVQLDHLALQRLREGLLRDAERVRQAGVADSGSAPRNLEGAALLLGGQTRLSRDSGFVR